MIEPDLSDWKVGYELEERGEVVEGCAAFLAGLSRDRHPGDTSGMNILEEVAPQFMSSLARAGQINANSLLRRALGSMLSAEVLSAPVYTDAIAGSLFTNANFRKVLDTLKNAIGIRNVRPRSSIWLVPQLPAWGATRALPIMLDQIAELLGADDRQKPGDELPRSVGLVAGKPASHLRDAFDLVVSGSDMANIPPGLEILLVPGLIAAISVHLPIEVARAVPVPVGLLTFDEPVVDRIQGVLQEFSRYYTEAGNGMNLSELRLLLDRVIS